MLSFVIRFDGEKEPRALDITIGQGGSRRCQDAFHTLYGNWVDAHGNKEVEMIDPSELELASMRKCLKAFGEAAGGRYQCTGARHHVFGRAGSRLLLAASSGHRRDEERFGHRAQ